MKVKYEITYFSKVISPAYKGLLRREIAYNYNIKRKENVRILEIHVGLLLSEPSGPKSFQLVRSQSNYIVEDEVTFTLNDLYEILINANFQLRNFLLKVKNIETHLKEVPDLPMTSLLSDLYRLQSLLSN